MRSRKVIDGNVVWFGSSGITDEGKAKFTKDKQSFDSGTEGIKDSLSIWLSILKGELWYNVTYGLSLLENVKYKIILDNEIVSMIEKHPDVINVSYLQSSVVNHKYTANVVINSIYGVQTFDF